MAAITEQEKVQEELRKRHEANLKADEKNDTADLTAAHERKVPSEIDALATQYSLSAGEAETVFDRTANGEDLETVVDEVRNGRTLNRPVYAEVPAGIASPFTRVDRVAPATPPPPEYLDPTQPRPNDPTAVVVRGAESPDSAANLAEDYAERAQEVADKVAETQEDLAEKAEANKGLTSEDILASHSGATKKETS